MNEESKQDFEIIFRTFSAVIGRELSVKEREILYKTFTDTVGEGDLIYFRIGQKLPFMDKFKKALGIKIDFVRSMEISRRLEEYGNAWCTDCGMFHGVLE